MVKLYTILVRKPLNYEQLLKEQKQMITMFHSKPEKFKIETIIELSKDEFENFKNNLSADYEFVENAEGIFLVKEKGTDNNSGLIVDAQGFSYARYVGIPMQECEIKKCPHCSRYFIEPPALSRKDNKLEICSECGQKEALELFFEHQKTQDFKKFLEEVQKNANLYNAKIIISVPGSRDVVIESNK